MLGRVVGDKAWSGMAVLTHQSFFFFLFLFVFFFLTKISIFTGRHFTRMSHQEKEFLMSLHLVKAVILGIMRQLLIFHSLIKVANILHCRHPCDLTWGRETS